MKLQDLKGAIRQMEPGSKKEFTLEKMPSPQEMTRLAIDLGAELFFSHQVSGTSVTIERYGYGPMPDDPLP